MKATEQLKAEHQGILLMLQILEAMCRRLESGKEVAAGDLDSVVEFLRVFVDKCHHGKEEDVLFPAMVEAGLPREGGPIGVMLAEHNAGRDYVKRISEAVAEYGAGRRDAAPGIVEHARGYISLLNIHIQKEDGVLYALADMHLSDAHQDVLAEEFEKIERDRIGPGRHEQFHELLKQLKRKYLR